MKIKQLSVFLENKPGTLSAACRVLADAKINIQTFSLADTREFGILRLIVPDAEKAKRALEKAGFAVKLTEVLALEVEDKPGGLAKILDALEHANVNLEYTYAFTVKKGGKGVLAFRFSDPDAAIAALKAAKVNVLGTSDLL
jgi:hypothetical protein